MSLVTRCVLAASAALGFFASGTSVAYPNTMHRSLFYENTPFGSLGWLTRSKTHRAARIDFRVDDLSAETCISLPTTGFQWFILNHSDANLGGETGYFSIRIVYRNDTEGEGGSARHGLHVYRNGNWYAADGTVAEFHERNPDQIAITHEEFIALHTSTNDSQGLAPIEEALGPWHMRPIKGGDSSWADRYLYGARLRANLTRTVSAISARLIRFTATSGVSTADPVIFSLDPLGATSALILVDAPRHDYQGSRRVYDVQFGGNCP